MSIRLRPDMPRRNRLGHRSRSPRAWLGTEKADPGMAQTFSWPSPHPYGGWGAQTRQETRTGRAVAGNEQGRVKMERVGKWKL